MSALVRIPDSGRTSREVRKVPEAEVNLFGSAYQRLDLKERASFWTVLPGETRGAWV
jgi:hypothetical protein